MTEAAIQKKIINMLEKEYGAYVVKVIVASKSGVPDILCSIDGTFVGIEVKRPESKSNVSKLQEYNLSKIEESLGKSMVAWNTDMVRDFIESEVL
ncbi:MAG: VRR-NUC domain-containing protein [Epsilonproteobacteria bacterium]|nr:MAG: VRR-NUC domain-containing protein [Campylobacterota bacterium]